MMDVPDIRRVLNGDRDALEDLCQAEWRPVYGLIYRTVQNRAEAQDLTQEVFLRALRSMNRYQETDAPYRAYLLTIARNLLRDQWRKRRLPATSLDDASELRSDEGEPEALVLAAIERESIEAALATLADDHRTVIQYRIIDGRSSPETAALMGRSPEAIRQLQRRALSALRLELTREVLV